MLYCGVFAHAQMKEFPAALHRLSERAEQSDAAEHEHEHGGIVFDVRG